MKSTIFKWALVLVVVAAAPRLVAECDLAKHEKDWVQVNTDRYRAIVIKVVTPSPLARATIVGCAFDDRTKQPLDGLDFEIFEFADAREKASPPRKDELDHYNPSDGHLKRVGDVIQAETREEGILIIEGLAPGTYALVPVWPSGSRIEKIGIDVDIRYTYDLDVPLAPTAQASFAHRRSN